MADLWNDNIPVATNTVAAEILDMEQNFGWLRRLVRMCVGWQDSTIATVGRLPHRARFQYKDADEYYIHPGSYFLDGTVRQVQFWDSAITFKFGSGGSNAGSTDLGASEWHYVYIDDSTMADGTSEITAASKFINSTTGPTWSDTKHGMYNGNDLFLFAVKTNADSEVTVSYHDGGKYVELDEKLISDAYQKDIDDTFTPVTLDAPNLGDGARVRVRFHVRCPTTGGGEVMWRKNGSSSSGIEVMYIHCTNTPRVIMPQEVITDSSQKIEVKLGDGDSTISVHTLGWYYPVGA